MPDSRSRRQRLPGQPPGVPANPDSRCGRADGRWADGYRDTSAYAGGTRSGRKAGRKRLLRRSPHGRAVAELVTMRALTRVRHRSRFSPGASRCFSRRAVWTTTATCLMMRASATCGERCGRAVPRKPGERNKRYGRQGRNLGRGRHGAGRGELQGRGSGVWYRRDRDAPTAGRMSAGGEGRSAAARSGMSGFSLPVNRSSPPGGRALVVGSQTCRSLPVEVLRSSVIRATRRMTRTRHWPSCARREKIGGDIA